MGLISYLIFPGKRPSRTIARRFHWAGLRATLNERRRSDSNDLCEGLRPDNIEPVIL
ncbi:MAG: hypothetical protein JNK03_03275 [Nitrospira sp.]|nr:hypothetical protein [Nitrospira sp.]